jgi:hypothetical protein
MEQQAKSRLEIGQEIVRSIIDLTGSTNTCQHHDLWYHFRFDKDEPEYNNVRQASEFLEACKKVSILYSVIRHTAINKQHLVAVNDKNVTNYNYCLSFSYDLPAVTVGFGYNIEGILATRNMMSIEEFRTLAIPFQIDWFLKYVKEKQKEAQAFCDYWNSSPSAEPTYTLLDISNGTIDYEQVKQLTPMGGEQYEKGNHKAACIVAACELQRIEKSKIDRIIDILVVEGEE